MTKENLNTNLENTDKLGVTSNKLKALKSAILGTLLSIVPINAIAQNNTSTDTTKSKTEVVNNNFPSPEKILEKHKISDIATATVEQLQAAFDEITNLLESETLKEDEEMSYITLRLKIRNQITVTKAKNETEKQRKKTALAKQIVEDLKGK